MGCWEAEWRCFGNSLKIFLDKKAWKCLWKNAKQYLEKDDMGECYEIVNFGMSYGIQEINDNMLADVQIGASCSYFSVDFTVMAN